MIITFTLNTSSITVYLSEIFFLDYRLIYLKETLSLALLKNSRVQKHILQQPKPTNSGSVLVKITMPL